MDGKEEWLDRLDIEIDKGIERKNILSENRQSWKNIPVMKVEEFRDDV